MASTAATGLASGPAPADGSTRRRTAGLVLVVAFVAFESLAVATVLPSVARELDGLRLYGWAFSAFLVTNLVGIVLAGEQSDRHGPVRAFVAGLLIFSAGLIVAGLAPSMLVLVAGRALQGFGGGGITAAIYVLIARAYDDAARPKVFALISSAWLVPALVGPAIAGTIESHFGWRMVFLGLPPLMLPTLVLLAPLLKAYAGRPPVASTDGDEAAGPAGGGRRTRVRESVRLATGVALVLGASQGAGRLGGALLVAGGVTLAAPALMRLLPAGTLSARRGLPAIILSRGLLTCAFFGAEAFLPLALAHRGLSPARAGIALTLGAVGWTAGSWTQARLAGRVPRATFVQAGFAVIAASIAGLAFAFAAGAPPALAIVAWCLSGYGMGAATASVSLLALALAPKGEDGATAAALQLADVIGNVAGTGAGGALLAAGLAAGSSVPATVAGIDALLVLVAAAGVFVAARATLRAGTAAVHNSVLPDAGAALAAGTVAT